MNIPPSPLGLFHQNDVQRLKEIGDYLNKSFEKSIAKVDFPTYEHHENFFLYHLSFGESEIRHVVLQEDISKSQRVESFFFLEINQNGKWESFYNGKIICYKKIICLENPVKSGQIRIKILDCRLEPVLKSIAVY